MQHERNYKACIALVKGMQVRCKPGSKQHDRLMQLEKELKRIRSPKRDKPGQLELVARRMAEIMQGFLDEK